MSRTKPSISCLPLASAIILAVFGLASKAQLVGCDAAGCPLDQYGQPVCVIGNLTSTEIGIANVSTTISPEPLTWTLSVSDSNDPTNSSQGIFSRNLYLGAPPSLDLQALTTVQGCALFFEGVSSNLAFPLHNLDTDVGTCSDAMNSACVNDLLAQANSTLDSTFASTNDSTTLCQTLEAKLRDNAPQTCTSVQNGSWGTISVKGLTGPTSSLPTEEGDCHPTTGKNYTISLVDSYSIIGPDEVTFMGNFVSGITPIMTIFIPSATSTVDGKLNATSMGAPELHLTCVKVVGSLNGCVGCGSSPGTTGMSSIVRPTMQLAIVTAVAVVALMPI